MNRIQFLYNEVQGWSDGEVTTLKPDVWSIKKLLVLDYYIEPFVKIMHSNKFNSWYYVDPFSGSGLLKLRERYLFPGSSIIPLLRANQSKFHRYYLSDSKSRYISALKNRVMRISQTKIYTYKYKLRNFLQCQAVCLQGISPQIGNIWVILYSHLCG
jgi:three-Cys-motif partner protein